MGRGSKNNAECSRWGLGAVRVPECVKRGTGRVLGSEQTGSVLVSGLSPGTDAESLSGEGGWTRTWEQ